MAATFDSTFQKGFTSVASPQSFVSNAGDTTGTVNANSNRVLMASVAFNVAIADVGTVTITWDSGGTNQAMTQITSVDLPGGSGSVFLFGLINPASGNLTLAVTWSVVGNHTFVLGATSFYNADQSTGWNNSGTDTGTSTSAASTVTTTSGDMAVVAHVNRNASSTTINAGTSAWINTNLDNNYAEAYSAASGSSTAVSWTLGTSVGWANAKANVIQSGGSGPGAGSDSGQVAVTESSANLIRVNIVEETS